MNESDLYRHLKSIRSLDDIAGVGDQPPEDQWDYISYLYQRLEEATIFTPDMERHWHEDRAVYDETGLPGKKVYHGNQIWYIHGLVHPQTTGWLWRVLHAGNGYIREIRRWVRKTDCPALSIVVFEQGLRSGFGTKAGFETGEIPDVFSVYPDELTEILKEESIVPWWYIADRLDPSRDTGSVFSLNGIDDLMGLRKEHRKIPEPFYSLYDWEFPYATMERSIAMYREIRQTYSHVPVVHIVTGLAHEPHLVALSHIHQSDTAADIEGFSSPLTADLCEREKERIIDYFHHAG